MIMNVTLQGGNPKYFGTWEQKGFDNFRAYSAKTPNCFEFPDFFFERSKRQIEGNWHHRQNFSLAASSILI